MMDPRLIDDLARRVQAALPEGIDELRSDLHRNLRAALAAALERMDLVTREEFDVQSAVLRRSREKLEALERKVAELEAEREERGEA